MDRQQVRDLRDNLAIVLNQFSIDNKVKATVGRAAFTDSNATFKVEIAEIKEGGVVEDKKATDFKRYSRRYGMQPTDLGRLFTLHGDRFKIVGAAPKSHKYPILCEKMGTGKIFKVALEDVKRCLSNETPKTSVPNTEKRSVGQILEDLRDVEAALSPENLSCDGEASQLHIRLEGARLRGKRAQLVAELGREPTEEELWGR